MKVLWLVNILMPEFAQSLGLEAVNVGGWLAGQLSSLKNENAEIFICTVSEKIKETSRAVINGTEYIAYPPTHCIEQEFKSLVKELAPDVIHIFGTESEQSLLMAEAAEYNRCLITIQGLLCEYKPHYFDGLPERYKRKSLIKAFFEKLLNKAEIYPDLIYTGFNKFCKNTKAELKLLKGAKYFSGRTHWDKAAVQRLNPVAQYFHLNENLRDSFYCSDKWSYEGCEQHRIFVSQANYPIKGFHMLLKAAYEVKKLFPNLHIYVGGSKPVQSGNFIVQAVVNYFFEYQTYIKKLIRKFNLEQNISFLGSLNAEEMQAQYLKANAFVSPSAIENSPNSVGEAMLLGTPVISSDVGGVSSLLVNEQEGLLYDFYDTKELSEKIIRIFSDKELAERLSVNARQRAQQTHNKQSNTKALLQIYEKIRENC